MCRLFAVSRVALGCGRGLIKAEASILVEKEEKI